MDTRRCLRCHKLLRANAPSCSLCGYVFLQEPVRRSNKATDGSHHSATVSFPSNPPTSPHRAGHYSGLHPEDQPYQSAMLAVQRPPARSSNLGAVVQQEKEEPEITPAPGLPRDLPEASSLPTLRRSTTPAGDKKEAHGLRAHQRYLP